MKKDGDYHRCSRRWNNNVYKRFREGDYGFSGEDDIGPYVGQYGQRAWLNYAQPGQDAGQQTPFGQFFKQPET